MAGTLIANTLVQDPDSGKLVSLWAGEPVPTWATALVGEHLIDGKAPAGDGVEDADEASDDAGADGEHEAEPPAGKTRSPRRR